MSTLTDEEWEAYKRDHGKLYPNAAEEALRRDIVATRKASIEEHNKKYEAGLLRSKEKLKANSDLTDEERNRALMGFLPISISSPIKHIDNKFFETD